MDSGIFRQHFRKFPELRRVCKKLRDIWCQEKVSDVSCTHPPTSTNWQGLLETIPLCTHAHTAKFRKFPESFRLYYASCNGRTACAQGTFPYGRCQKLSSKYGPACLQTISLPSAWWANASEGRWSVFELCKQLRLFRSKPAPFLRLGHLACKARFPTILARGALAAVCRLRL